LLQGLLSSLNLAREQIREEQLRNLPSARSESNGTEGVSVDR
jgi:hypothetical protein